MPGFSILKKVLVFLKVRHGLFEVVVRSLLYLHLDFSFVAGLADGHMNTQDFAKRPAPAGELLPKLLNGYQTFSEINYDAVYWMLEVCPDGKVFV